MSEAKPICPRCGSQHTVKNGRIHNKKPKHKCQDCGRQFIENPTKKYILQPTLDYINKMLLEKISLAGIARVTGVSKKWLQDYVNDLYAKVHQQLEVTFKPPGKLIIECDEAWSFVNSKGNKQWIWLALNAKTREIVGVYIGDRSRQSALKFWDSLPPVYRQCAVCYTDFWEAYQGVIPIKRHKAVEKDSGKTNHVERFNNTMRQRISRLTPENVIFFQENRKSHWSNLVFYSSLQ